ncbi:MAG: hypothetical protein PHO01_12920 [Desulfotomaculaceae bacterium]|nr:hypothetical protein [Desulfotomaculaceae bacterium]
MPMDSLVERLKAIPAGTKLTLLVENYWDTPERGVGGKMIDKIKGKYRLICDICGEAAEEVFSTFDEAVDYKVDSEWISRKQDGEWADICPNCYSIKGGRRQ